MRRLFLALVAVGVAGGVAGCGDSPVSAPTPPQQSLIGPLPSLSFVQFESSAYAAAEKSGSFWAVRGQDRQIILRYTDTGAEFLRFEVGAKALHKRPDGTTFQLGDSVLITVNVDASGKMSYAFEPSGLRFLPSANATLTLNYSRADPASLLLGVPLIYRTNNPLLGWELLPTVNLFGNAAQANVDHFTDFALAID